MERRYDASIAGAEPVYQPPTKPWALSAHARWLAMAASKDGVNEPLPVLSRPPSPKERIALRREILQALEAAAVGDTPRWLRIFNEMEPLLGPPTVDIQSDSPGGRSGSWIHEAFIRAVDRPTPGMLSVVSRLLAKWIIQAQQSPSLQQQWGLLVPPMPVMAVWHADMGARFDLLLIDACRSLLEHGVSSSSKDADKPEVLRSLLGLLQAATVLDRQICPPLCPEGDRHFTHALDHLRLQVDAVVPALAQFQSVEAPQPHHVPAGFRMASGGRPSAMPTWKTGACSIIDCFEHSRILREHILTTKGAFDAWTQSLTSALKSLPEDQASVLTKRIDALRTHPQITLRPGFGAAITQALMLGITPVTANSDPRPAPRF